MSEYVEAEKLRINKALHELVRDEIAPGTGVDPAAFWSSLEAIVRDLGPENAALLAKRDDLQTQLDDWHRERKGQVIDVAEYRKFLLDIGYMLPEGEAFEASTANVDPEIATMAGPQLVVPVDNARYALNAANARWGSLYDALYGTDAIADTHGAERQAEFNPVRGARVVETAAAFLDSTAGLAEGSYVDVTAVELVDVDGRRALRVTLSDGRQTGLADSSKFVAFNESGGELETILLRNNGLHIEIHFDREKPIGRTHPAGINDVWLESAITTIQDCEDSVAAVDAEDKVRVYRNWLGIMKGTLETSFNKSGQQVARKLNGDRTYTDPDGKVLTLPGRSLLLVRNVGLHMYTDAVTSGDGKEIPEGILDAMVTCLAARHDLDGQGSLSNSRAGSIRTRRGRRDRRAVQPRGRRSGLGTEYDQDWHHGRRATIDGELERVHSRGQGTGHLYQHGLPGPHRRRNPYHHGGRSSDPEGRHESIAVDSCLRRPQRGECGRCPTRCVPCWTPRRHIQKRAPTPPGSRHPPPQPCTPCITTR
jgi:malate synthase